MLTLLLLHLIIQVVSSIKLENNTAIGAGSDVFSFDFPSFTEPFNQTNSQPPTAPKNNNNKNIQNTTTTATKPITLTPTTSDGVLPTSKLPAKQESTTQPIMTKTEIALLTLLILIICSLIAFVYYKKRQKYKKEKFKKSLSGLSSYIGTPIRTPIHSTAKTPSSTIIEGYYDTYSSPPRNDNRQTMVEIPTSEIKHSYERVFFQ